MIPYRKAHTGLKFIVILLLVVSPLTVNSQKAMTFQDAESRGIRLTMLDSTYKSGLHADSSLAVFWSRQEEFIGAYRQMLQTFGDHLKTNGFMWGKETKCFNRIYFSHDGAIDYFLYNFSKDQVSVEQEKVFDTLLNGFIKTYRFPLKADTRFSQCSPVRYNDKK